MDKIKVVGGKTLSGQIYISGSKNSVVSLIPAALLSDEVVIKKIPHISDVDNLEKILSYLNVKYEFKNDFLYINSSNLINKEITTDYSTKLRASYYFMGALLGRYKKVSISLPGGCEIGARTFDYHLKAFEKMGAKIVCEDDLFVINAEKLKGAHINLPFPSVGATVNILLAAVKAEGETLIENAACEPEIGNLIDFLVSMGAKISGKNTNCLIVEGVSELSGGSIEVIPDRIEAGTYILAGVMNGDNLEICDVEPSHLTSFFDVLDEMGADYKIEGNKVITNRTDILKPVNIETKVYPGFATDLQQPITTLLVMANGESTVRETIYENRFQNTIYLNSMGADIIRKGDTIYVNGPTKLEGRLVKTSDLRAGAALILAALSAKGETTITDIKHLLRGYGDLIQKLSNVGAEIWLEDE
ncbi:MAG: UDP-N-acetylglucosamine 1-carboxyvinyltransferase [Bacilli bacterium]|nr:UDP-N-acetylglucosamine 1-carboxyvinyltransferase [Bacilli bacterium]